jgi:hypothetical protein
MASRTAPLNGDKVLVVSPVLRVGKLGLRDKHAVCVVPVQDMKAYGEWNTTPLILNLGSI